MISNGLTFGRFRYDPGLGVLTGENGPVRLSRRGGLLLETLLRRRGEVVSKADLVDAAWGSEAVEESNLSVQIAQLRKALGAHGWISTIERVGYRFLPAPIAAEPRASLPSLAVLPFAVLGPADDSACARIIVEDIEAALSRFGSLQVLAAAWPRTQLEDRRYTLEGSLRGSAGQRAIAVRLIDGRSGACLWADRFSERGSEDTGIAAADSIAAEVEHQVRIVEMATSRRERPQSMSVYDLHQRGQSLMRTFRPDDNRQAITLYEEALALNPDSIALLAGACEARMLRLSMGWPWIGDDDRARAHDLAERGLRHPDADGHALALIGACLFHASDEDFGLALSLRAAELNPGSVVNLVCAGANAMHWGKIADGEAFFRRAIALNPRDRWIASAFCGLSRIRMMAGRFEDALAFAQRALSINADYGSTHWTLIAASATLGREEDANRHLTRFRAIQPGVTVRSIKTGRSTRSTGMATTLEGLEQAGLATS